MLYCDDDFACIVFFKPLVSATAQLDSSEHSLYYKKVIKKNIQTPAYPHLTFLSHYQTSTIINLYPKIIQ